MKFMKANGLVIHYLDQGRRDGPPVVFINSLGTDFRIWNEVAEILAPDFRILLHDKRGHGLSESGPDKNDIADYARDLEALLDGVGVGRATIVGLSVGGLIAQELYRQSPERVAALVLCDTAAKIGTDEVWDQRIGEVQRGGIEALADAVMERWFTAHFRSARSTSLPACAPCLRGRRGEAIWPPAGP
jgi:3-oxoadipate enol-lactonase